jgi:hypothetical protein
MLHFLILLLNVVILSVAYSLFLKVCCQTERIAMLSVVMLSVVMLSVVMLSVIMLIVVASLIHSNSDDYKGKSLIRQTQGCFQH